jgi:hypothetical protein
MEFTAMTKAEALYYFWSQFGVPAFDENTIPTGADSPSMPYITYESSTDSLGGELALTGSLWSRSASWESAENLAELIAATIAGRGFWITKIKGGYLRIFKRSPFAQRMADPSDDMIRRIVINITAEFMTAY